MARDMAKKPVKNIRLGLDNFSGYYIMEKSRKLTGEKVLPEFTDKYVR